MRNIDDAVAAFMKAANPMPQPTAEQVAEMSRKLVQSGYLDRYAPDAHRELARYYAAAEMGDKRGLCCIGQCGTGKTMFIQRYCRPRMLTAAMIVARYVERGMSDAFAEWVHGHYRDTYVSQPPTALAIDELGDEPTAIRFGERRELLSEIIAERYRIWQDRRIPTYLTSNMDSHAIDGRYGRRVTDRIREMCVVIKFEGTSARGEQ